MSAVFRLVQVAVPTPLAHYFDYLLPEDCPVPAPGCRVRVPFGRREVVGVVLACGLASKVPRAKLKVLSKLIDSEPLLPASLLALLNWAADYYHHPIGEVIQTSLPALLRRGAPPAVAGETVYALSDPQRDIPAGGFRRSPMQQRVYAALREHPDGLRAAQLDNVAKNWRSAMKRLDSRGWIDHHRETTLPRPSPPTPVALQLSPAQAAALAAILAATGGYQAILLHGITGSGKTEVYLRAIEHVVARGGQVLVVVPEIGLTPQLLQRFTERLNVPVAVMHSALSDRERLAAWEMARSGQAAVLLGTRSAVFTPVPKLALIIVDEEHDASLKQQDGFRYHARDIAIKRASQDGLPILLGSATPSLESLHNAQQGRFQLLSLPERAGAAQPPRVKLLDLRRLKLNEGLSPPLIDALHECLARREQSLLFLNRRGFAPVLMCHDCGWLAPCARCDARLTVHRQRQMLCCHHCGAEAQLPGSCPACGSSGLHGIGEGTERIESTLARLFPQARIERVDRDSTRRKGALEAVLARVHAGESDILIGTQMLVKGHDFPNLTLVGVLNADQGLYNVDFRAEERLVQQLLQVTGRAGRADKPGTVLVQTHHPDNPAFAALAQQDYREFANFALTERAAARFPPFGHLVLLRAESPKPDAALGFLRAAQNLSVKAGIPDTVQVMDPVPSPMERRAGRYRAQLLVQAGERRALHDFLNRWRVLIEQEKHGRRVRWSLDVDPIDMY